MILKGIITASVCNSQKLVKQGWNCCSRAISLGIVRMSKTERPDHLQRTADDTREEIITDATVTHIKDLSATVKQITLKVQDQRFSFKAGQWVDFFIPSVETVGGYSMCSSPSLCKLHQKLELAVKFCKHPPAYWVHTECHVGSDVKMRVGGTFYYDPLPEDERNILLIAGGVGINPLLSIMLHASDIEKRGGTESKPRKVTLLFSAKNEEELIFKDELAKLVANNPNMSCKYFVTKDKKDCDNGVKYSRINQEDITASVTSMDSKPKDLLTYLCGPGPMIDSMEKLLLDIGVPKDAIIYEKWW